MIVIVYEPDPLEAEQKDIESVGGILAIEPIFREGTAKAVSQMLVLQTMNIEGNILNSYRLKCSEEGILSLQRIGSRKIPAVDVKNKVP